MTSTATPDAVPSTFLGKVGVAATAIVKHVPTRMALWASIGFVTGILGVVISYLVGVVVLERASIVLAYLISIPLSIPPLGAVLFGMHGLHRGAARAALALEEKFGLVAHVVDRVLARLEARFGEKLANLPLQQLEVGLKEAVAAYLGSRGEDEGRGLVRYVVRRARGAIARRIETYFLAAYRAEMRSDGSGGGVAMQKVREQATRELSSRLGEILMSPLNKQLAILMTLYLLLAAGWWFWLFLILMVPVLLAGHGG